MKNIIKNLFISMVMAFIVGVTLFTIADIPYAYEVEYWAITSGVVFITIYWWKFVVWCAKYTTDVIVKDSIKRIENKKEVK